MRCALLRPVFILENMLFSWLVISSRPGGAMISIPAGDSDIFISMFFSSRWPWRSFFLNTCRALVFVPTSLSSSSERACGRRTSRILSSARFSARCCTFWISFSRIIFTATSAKSRTIDSTSRPTYPTSVNLVASTLMNGAWASFASRRAISVLPTPVGPIIRIFFGVISLRNSSSSFMRRQRFLSAIATARFAASCPTICLSSSEVISLGVIMDISRLHKLVGTSSAFR